MPPLNRETKLVFPGASNFHISKNSNFINLKLEINPTKSHPFHPIKNYTKIIIKQRLNWHNY